ncbi:hypothetical protein KU392_00420 [Advenella alkanexedens]|jgi:Spy/CpxP family protein refolding chaperone|uniref:DUF4148 domain-containing protein n=1 Tax=Advenella alkanexedens TaxID=1481665 RepID=A0ABS6NJA5_9BURK|nr:MULTISPECIES: hypothetical protein [Advenella]MBV4395716.1 hypothetical protein [Advenella alkanexedens]NLN68931.1 hypothetical protein [Alcaligenaceae bacterium]
MRKYIIPALVALTASAMVQAVQAQERDTRSAWAKSQDMYVEPTLRIRESTVVLTPEQAQQLNAGAQLPVGSYQADTTVKTIVYPDGRTERVQETSTTVVPAAPQGTAPVQDMSSPK